MLAHVPCMYDGVSSVFIDLHAPPGMFSCLVHHSQNVMMRTDNLRICPLF